METFTLAILDSDQAVIKVVGHVQQLAKTITLFITVLG